MNDRVLIDYTNWRGARSIRLVVPGSIFYGESVFHGGPDRAWYLDAMDVEKGSRRTFAMKDIHSWSPALDPVAAEN